jgi:predicted ATPase/transcriptional regulator with XRE-family HTH domain
VADEIDATLAQLLKRLRHSAGLTQEQLAEAAGISARAVSDLERGINRTARRDTARLLADALRLSGSWREEFEALARGQARATEEVEERAAGHLPIPLTPLVGRADEVRKVCGQLRGPDIRLVTISGLGGVGKTRMALAIVRELSADFPDGVFFISLATVRDAQLVMTSIARGIAVRDSGPEPLWERITKKLRPMRALLFIDNFEQVLDAAVVVSDLLSTCPHIKCIVTSRCALRLNGEHEHTAIPLNLPPATKLSLPELMSFPSVELFVQRVKSALPAWTLDEHNALTVVEICRKLDGLPLALELAAARIKILSPDALLKMLGSQQDLLSGGARDSVSRHQTLRATLDWSYELLDADAALLLPRLSVFSGGWTLDAMAEVCGIESGVQAIDALAALVDNSLVWRADGPVATRFMLPVTIREYAAAKLHQTRNAHVFAQRHLEWFLHLAETAESQLAARNQLSWLRTLGDEHANLRAALEYALEARDSLRAHRLAGALWKYWEINGHLAEGRRWISRVLQLADPVPAAVRAHVFKAAGNLARDQGDLDAAIESHSRALTLFEQAGDWAGVAAVLNNLGAAELDRGDTNAAIGYFETSLERFREINDDWGVALALCNLAHALRTSAQHERAEAIARESIRSFECIGDMRGKARSVLTLATIVGRSGQLIESLDLNMRAAKLFIEVGDRAGFARSLEYIAWTHAKLGDAERATWLLGHAEGLRMEVGEPLSADDRVEYEETIDEVRSALDPDAWTTARTEGRNAPLTEVLRHISIEDPAGDYR